MQKMKAKALTAILLMAIVLAVLPLTVHASTGYIRIDPATVSVPAGGNVNLNFTEVLFSGGQFYLILSTNGYSDQTGVPYSDTTKPFGVAQLINNSVTTYTYGSMSWNVGFNWVNGSIPLNIAGGNYFIKAFDGAATSLAVTDIPITVTGAFTVSPTSGPGGAYLKLSGYAFATNALVNITYYNTTSPFNKIPVAANATNVPADALGQFNYTLYAPDLKQILPAGNNPVTWTTITFNAKEPAREYNATYNEYARGIKTVKGDITVTAAGLWGNGTISGVSRQINQTIQLVGLYFYPGVATIWWDATTNITTTTVNSTGGFDKTFNVPQTGIGPHWIVVQDAGGVLFYVQVTVTPTMILNPTSGPAGTLVAVTAYGFPASVGSTSYNVTLTWMPSSVAVKTNITTDATGQFATTFYAPPDFGGIHAVVASANGTTIATAFFTITPGLTVTPSTFANNCTFLVTVNGTGFDPVYNWIFYVDNAFYSNWFVPTEGGTVIFHLASGGWRPGMHKVSVIRNDGVSPYNIEAYATFTVTEGNDIETAYLHSINDTVQGLSGLTGVNASMLNDIYANTVTIKGNTVTLLTDTGIIKANLSTLMPQITSISNGIVQIQTTLGGFSTSLSSIQATLNTVAGTVATISTTLGDVTASLANINTIVTATGTTLVTVQTDVGEIKGTVTSIEGDVATIQTDIGTLQTSVDEVKTSVDAIPGKVNLPIYIAVALALVAAIAAILTLIMMRRKIAG